MGWRRTIIRLHSSLGLAPRRLIVTLVATGAIAAAFGSAAAQAATSVTTACGTFTLSEPFLPWSDSNLYSLLPGGDFEGGLAGWTLSGGAKVVAGSEPYAATGVQGSHSLSLPSGATVQTPFTCVVSADHTIRFFAVNNQSSSSVLVQVVYVVAGHQIAVPVGIVSGDRTWSPSAAMQTGAALANLISGSASSQVAFRFTAGGGASQIDDIFIDPRMKH